MIDQYENTVSSTLNLSLIHVHISVTDPLDNLLHRLENCCLATKLYNSHFQLYSNTYYTVLHQYIHSTVSQYINASQILSAGGSNNFLSVHTKNNYKNFDGGNISAPHCHYDPTQSPAKVGSNASHRTLALPTCPVQRPHPPQPPSVPLCLQPLTTSPTSPTSPSLYTCTHIIYIGGQHSTLVQQPHVQCKK